MKSNNSLKHISFIMDGNGRWAKKRLLPRTAGHSKGVQKAKEVVLYVKEQGIPYLSLYTFSKENWKRSQEEVSFLMKLILNNFKNELDFYRKNKVRLVHIGDREGLPVEVLEAIDNVTEDTKHYTALTVMICLNYSGKYDITQATNRVLAEGKAGVSEEEFSKYLLTSDYPDPDLIFRTSGEFRVSNYFLWQAAYSEFYISDSLWPDLKMEEVGKAIESYAKRNRRYGGVKDE